MTSILTVARGLPPCFPEDFEYTLVEVMDDPEEDLQAHFDTCFRAIEDGRDRGGVVVHCLAGTRPWQVNFHCSLSEYLIQIFALVPGQGKSSWLLWTANAMWYCDLLFLGRDCTMLGHGSFTEGFEVTGLLRASPFLSSGVSRSVTVVVAYLMWKKKVSLEDALAQVKRCRPIAHPNYGFLQQLRAFEDTLRKQHADW